MASTRKDEARLSELQAEMTRIHTDAGDNDLSGEMRSRWEALETEQRTLNNRIARQRLINEYDRNAPAVPLDDGDRQYVQMGVGLLAAIRAAMGDTDREAGRAREASQELARRSGRGPQQGGILWNPAAAPRIEHRVVTTGQQSTSGNGSALVQHVQRADLFVDVLRNALIVARLGGRYIPNLSGSVSIPRKTASSNVFWVGEGQPITASDPTFDQINMTPKTAGAITEFSRNMVLQSSPEIEQLAQDDLARDVASAIDMAALVGTGTGYQPAGIATVSPNVSYSKSGAVYSDFTGALTRLETANVNASGWALGSGVRGALMATAQTGAENVLMGLNGSIFGLP
ncbi:HK97 family phage major capsid protein [Endobacter medicaginis]|uniref:Phage major capsid protein n=1 Tax=Endobacter medicaginis TaxID=1181271 RepID=A0A839V847_9PROT|nr:HK97 family phage major capsid protein [Endobacter medicaginis]NVN30604.1 phage major capsid protein [Endobacter medicaginis]